MPVKLSSAEKSSVGKGVKLKETMPVLRSGGENVPFEYPHLYRIQAGDWRISYAVEHNRLAILVLEVLNADGTPRKDEDAQDVEHTMKIKLLDWPEGSPSRDLPPEELGRKFKIKFLDLADELKPGSPQSARTSGGIKLSAPANNQSGKHRITFVDATARNADDPDESTQGKAPRSASEGKVTPLDGPSM